MSRWKEVRLRIKRKKSLKIALCNTNKLVISKCALH